MLNAVRIEVNIKYSDSNLINVWILMFVKYFGYLLSLKYYSSARVHKQDCFIILMLTCN